MTRKHVGIVLVLVVVCLIAGWPSASEGAKPQPKGKFISAGFTPPDFSNGGTATVTPGALRIFTAVCTCARQPGNTPCSGSVELEIDDGQGWTWLAADVCSAGEGESCGSTFEYAFDSSGTFRFRVVCDEADGNDAVQDEAGAVTITVEDVIPACTGGETRPCPLQQGVCAGSMQECDGGEWQPCNYGELFEEPEATCGDGLDNDCDSRVDFVDTDGDGIPLCGGHGVINELFLSEVNAPNSLEVYEYRNGSYEEAWSTFTADTNGAGAGGEAGDLTGNGIPEVAIQRIIGSSGNRLEVWAFDAIHVMWYRLWAGPSEDGYGLKIGDIVDADGDGRNELLVSDQWGHQLVLYAWDGLGFEVESVVQECPNSGGAMFIGASGDLDGDGTPEILFQCASPHPIYIREHDGGTDYPVVGTVQVPFNSNGEAMIIDDIETGDVNRDGLPDAVFCGNSGQAHVLTYQIEDETYLIEYTSPPPSEWGIFSQTCSIGDVTRDGVNDFMVVNPDAIRVFSYDGSGYYEVWSDGPVEITPGLGSSFVGDADNDGLAEFLWGRPIGAEAGYHLYDSDDVPAADFSVAAAFGTIYGGGTIIIGNLNPMNDEPLVDCDDTNPDQGAFEVCGDDIDNDCDGEIDEDCDFNFDFCGDNMCGGSAVGESCTTCADDCGCLGPGCKHGCCGDGVCGKLENTSNCPVDCT